MEARPVDPRDVERDVDDPVYRVCFWERGSFPGVPAELAGYRSEEYELAGANDVREVLRWADENAGPNRSITVYVVLDGCAIRLCGDDPTRSSRP